MNCPKCGEESLVTDSRKTDGGWHTRLRRCPVCEHRFSTREVLVGGSVGIILPGLRGRLVARGSKGLQVELFAVELPPRKGRRRKK